MPVLLGRHDSFRQHYTGRSHPERPERLEAVLRGVAESGVVDDLVDFEPRLASRNEVARVHDDSYIKRLEDFCAAGGGFLDPDTAASTGSFDAALRAAGAGVDAAERLVAGEAEAAFLAVRPPGHHALRDEAMGFCLFNSVAVAAAHLAAKGDRVVIVDWDAHHGNGTQDIFYESRDVLYVSFHQYPFYPGTGALHETGAGAGKGATVNLPLPQLTTGDVYRAAFDRVVIPVTERFRPDWVLVSAGFDAHRADPLTELGLSAGDFGDLTTLSMSLAPAGRRIAFLEGGYDVAALEVSVASCVAALAGVECRPERVTSGGPYLEAGSEIVATAERVHGLS